MIANRSMPPGAFIPELGYADVPAAAAWLCRAFGFSERLRIADHRIQLTFDGGSMVVVEGPQHPDAAHATTHAVMVHVADVDAHHARAKREGARIVREPASHPFGERQYTALDPGGHRWTFSQSIADVDPADWGGVLVGRS
ncbi:MAG TPA: VOC family protein [Rhodanobacteraceae bacterium]|nr:VOC family protein [Rhodanobacteraceae bacterium]